MKQLIFFVLISTSFFSFSQHEEYKRTTLPGNKLKYEYKVHRKRDYLVKDFFDQFCNGDKHYVMTENSNTAVARITKNGFEIVGDAHQSKFLCEEADLLIDCWYKYAKINSN